MSDWIKVIDGHLPELGEKVWVFTNGVVQEEPFELFLNYYGYFWNHDDFEELIAVDYENDLWQEITPPEPPKD